MAKKEPNKFIAPIVIAGIAAGFFISAYKFVFAKSKQKKPAEPNQAVTEHAPSNENLKN
jgi:hypothetical protein